MRITCETLGVIHKYISSKIADFFRYFANSLPPPSSLADLAKRVILQHSLWKIFQRYSTYMVLFVATFSHLHLSAKVELFVFLE